ncbi:hypothetical protein K438DRAFT_1829844 [Mycena galopus ATCC 62051]|nr:hypothetical protein K438DRAFT_1829844 [Mycena galopus ATCC 62051]
MRATLCVLARERCARSKCPARKAAAQHGIGCSRWYGVVRKVPRFHRARRCGAIRD